MECVRWSGPSLTPPPGGGFPRRVKASTKLVLALHAKPRTYHLGAGILVLDVGRTWSDLGRSNAGHPKDYLRSVETAKGPGALPRRIIAAVDRARIIDRGQLSLAGCRLLGRT
jgi:hypothetical protein